MTGRGFATTTPRFSVTEVTSPGVSASPSHSEQPGTEFLREHGGVWLLPTLLLIILTVSVLTGRRRRG